MALEKQLEKRCREYIERKYNGKLIKMKTLKGIPDRIAILPRGLVLFTEFKQPGKTPEKIQHWWLRWLRRRGFVAFWCDNFEHFKGEVDELVDPSNVSDGRWLDNRLERMRESDAAGLDEDDV